MFHPEKIRLLSSISVEMQILILKTCLRYFQNHTKTANRTRFPANAICTFNNVCLIAKLYFQKPVFCRNINDKCPDINLLGYPITHTFFLSVQFYRFACDGAIMGHPVHHNTLLSYQHSAAYVAAENISRPADVEGRRHLHLSDMLRHFRLARSTISLR